THHGQSVLRFRCRSANCHFDLKNGWPFIRSKWQLAERHRNRRTDCPWWVGIRRGTSNRSWFWWGLAPIPCIPSSEFYLLGEPASLVKQSYAGHFLKVLGNNVGYRNLTFLVTSSTM